MTDALAGEGVFPAVQEMLGRLRDEVDAILLDASPGHLTGAINWGDLSCVQASLNMADDGSLSFGVLIEEAAPDERALIAYVRKKLAAKKWVNVEVKTQW